MMCAPPDAADARCNSAARARHSVSLHAALIAAADTASFHAIMPILHFMLLIHFPPFSFHISLC